MKFKNIKDFPIQGNLVIAITMKLLLTLIKGELDFREVLNKTQLFLNSHKPTPYQTI